MQAKLDAGLALLILPPTPFRFRLSLRRSRTYVIQERIFPMSEKTIYEQIGGAPAVEAAVNLFYQKVLADQRIAHFFNDVNMPRQIA
jgi:hypothetical protein